MKKQIRKFQFLIGTVQPSFIRLEKPIKYSFQFLIGTVQQQYLCDLRDTLFQNIVYNTPKSRSIYFPGHPTNRVKSAFLKTGKSRS